MKNISRNEQTTETLKGMAQALDRMFNLPQGESVPAELGCSAAVMVVVWPDGSFTYNSFVSPSPAATLTLAGALRCQTELLEGDVRARMQAAQNHKIAALVSAAHEAQARKNEGRPLDG